jgi:rhodanese-related sulfurtransferase
VGYAGDVTPEQAWAMVSGDERAVLVDVRTAAEWTYVGVPEPSPAGSPLVTVEWKRYPDGAVNPSFVDELRVALSAVDGDTRAGEEHDRPLVFLCRSGVRSVAAARAATAAGLGPCFNVLDGFEGQLGDDGHRGGGGWRAAGLPWSQS